MTMTGRRARARLARMAVDSDQAWNLMVEASEDLAAEIGLDERAFSPRSLPAIDRWIEEQSYVR